jgi:hypothetical protein
MAEVAFFTLVSILLKWNLQKLLYMMGLVYMILKYIHFLQAVVMKSYAFIAEVD